jgi:hypothetical protein
MAVASAHRVHRMVRDCLMRVIWLLFPMSETRDVALERVDDLLRARRHGAAHRNRRIQLQWGWWFVRLKTKKIFNR